MTSHRTGTRDQWLAERLELLAAEKEITRLNDDLARRRRELPWVRVDKEYAFDTEDGAATLADLFRGRSQLLVYHFMFDPDWDEGCPSCSSLADGFDETHLHLQNHDVAFTGVSRAPLEKLLAYRDRMGWSFPWASSRAERLQLRLPCLHRRLGSTGGSTTTGAKSSSRRSTSTGESGPASNPA